MLNAFTSGALASFPIPTESSIGYINPDPTPNTGIPPTVGAHAVINQMIANNLNLLAAAGITPVLPTSVAAANQTLLAVQHIAGTIGYTVATLPAGTIGMKAYVTDATSPTYLATLVGGGAVVSPAFYNGTHWVSA